MSQFSAKEIRRGRPNLVTSQRLAEAILAIKGRDPRIEELAESLGVSRATLYNHVAGQEALIQHACNVAICAWVLPEAPAAMHWSLWARTYAMDPRRLINEYPYLTTVMGPRPGPVLDLIDRVVGALTSLGLHYDEAFYTQYVLTALAGGIGVVLSQFSDGRGSSGSFGALVLAHEPETPHLDKLIQGPLLDAGDSVFEDLVYFSLVWIASRRGEELPEEIRRTEMSRRGAHECRLC